MKSRIEPPGLRSTHLRKRPVSCRCPRCGQQHILFMVWTGRGMPRKYCRDCRSAITGYDGAVFIEMEMNYPGNSKWRGRMHDDD